MNAFGAETWASPRRQQHLLAEHRWLVFLLPFSVFMLVGPVGARAARRRRHHLGPDDPLRLVSTGLHAEDRR